MCVFTAWNWSYSAVNVIVNYRAADCEERSGSWFSRCWLSLPALRLSWRNCLLWEQNYSSLSKLILPSCVWSAVGWLKSAEQNTGLHVLLPYAKRVSLSSLPYANGCPYARENFNRISVSINKTNSFLTFLGSVYLLWFWWRNIAKRHRSWTSPGHLLNVILNNFKMG